ncbi:MAG: MarR family transcriptional regulator [Acidobacteriota bacterium]|jgi:DNA-binding MarR family transcriptional regulator
MTTQAQENVLTAPADGSGDLLPALDHVFAETVALFQRLRAVAPLMHSHEDLAQDECTVLQGLDRDGPRTITGIGEDCGIPRNQAQKLVKALEKKNLVAMVDNPENKRAKLAELTDPGRDVIRSLDQREVELLTSLPLQASAADLQAAANALAAVRQAFSNDQWQKLLNNGSGK